VPLRCRHRARTRVRQDGRGDDEARENQGRDNQAGGEPRRKELHRGLPNQRCRSPGSGTRPAVGDASSLLLAAQGTDVERSVRVTAKHRAPGRSTTIF
jgi:hypothetical protein